MSRRWRNLPTTFRQRRFDPPWAAAAPATTPAVPVVLRQSRRAATGVRRGRFFNRPQVSQLAPLAFVEPASRPRLPRTRHGVFFAPLLTQAAASPALRRQSRRAAVAPIRRGEFFSPPLAAQSPPEAPSFPPKLLRPTSNRSLLIRRGEFQIIPLAGAAPQVPAVPPKLIRQSSRRLMPRRYGEFQPVIRAVAPPASPTMAPKVQGRQRRPLTAVRRGRFQSLPLVGGGVPPVEFFVCQDFAGTATPLAYAGAASVLAHGGSRFVVSYGGSAVVESYGGDATNCGR